MTPRGSKTKTDAVSDASEIEIREHLPADDLQRDALVRTAPEGSFFQLSGWRRFVHELYGHEPVELAAWRDGELVGFLPLMDCRGFLGSRKLISMPYAVYGGPTTRAGTSEPGAIKRALVAEARAVADQRRVQYMELRYEDEPDDDATGTDLYWTFQRELPDDPDGVLAAMPKKSRAEARKARKRHGLELTEGVWYADDLYRLFLHNKHTLGSPALPPEHFKRLLAAFPRDTYVHLVRKGRDPLAAVMSFAFGDTLIAYYAGTSPDADRSYSASNFMYMALQEWAVERGFKVFDFCRSRGDSGAFRFKVHQGFEPEPLHYRYFHWMRDQGAVPSFTPSNPRTAHPALHLVASSRCGWSRRGSDSPGALPELSEVLADLVGHDAPADGHAIEVDVGHARRRRARFSGRSSRASVRSPTCPSSPRAASHVSARRPASIVDAGGEVEPPGRSSGPRNDSRPWLTSRAVDAAADESPGSGPCRGSSRKGRRYAGSPTSGWCGQ